jgi:hypothetical protein
MRRRGPSSDVGAGKDSNIYLADRDNMGKFRPAPPIDTNIYQVVTGALAGQVYSTPAFFNGVLYYGAVGDTLKAFPMTNAKLATTSSSQSAVRLLPWDDAECLRQWNPERNRVGIGISNHVPPLRCCMPTMRQTWRMSFTTADRLPAGGTAFGNGNKYITPLIVNGKVYVGTPTGVAVFGILAQ